MIMSNFGYLRTDRMVSELHGLDKEAYNDRVLC